MKKRLLFLFSTLGLFFALLVGCELPNETQLASYQGLGLKVFSISLDRPFTLPGTPMAKRRSISCVRADAGRGPVTIEKFKIFYANDNRLVTQESAWFNVNQVVDQNLFCTPEKIMPDLFLYGWVGFLFTGTDQNGDRVVGYNQIQYPAGALSQPGSILTKFF